MGGEKWFSNCLAASIVVLNTVHATVGLLFHATFFWQVLLLLRRSGNCPNSVSGGLQSPPKDAPRH